MSATQRRLEALRRGPNKGRMVGRIYQDAGRKARRRSPARPGGPVLVVTQWRGRGPRNVLVQPVRPCYRDDDCAMYACSCGNTGWLPTGEPEYVRLARGLVRVDNHR